MTGNDDIPRFDVKDLEGDVAYQFVRKRGGKIEVLYETR